MRKQRVATSRFLRHVKPFLHFFENFFGAGMPAAAAGNRECLNFSKAGPLCCRLCSHLFNVALRLGCRCRGN
jgi:hypothetical protein